MPPKCFESEVESFLEGSHGDRTHIKRADHHTVTPLCGTLLSVLWLLPWRPAGQPCWLTFRVVNRRVVESMMALLPPLASGGNNAGSCRVEALAHGNEETF